MKKLPIFLVLILIIAWWYTSWYWYVCNIKWLCDLPQSNTQQNIVSLEDTVSENNPDLQEEREEREENEIINMNTWTLLTADDVTSWERAEVVAEEIEESVSEEVVEGKGTDGIEDSEINICTDPLVWPIAFWWNNDVDEVVKLENFIATVYGASTKTDGIYDQDELDLIKEFQLEYKEDILEPWGLSEATGYVWRTTVQKINEIACK